MNRRNVRRRLPRADDGLTLVELVIVVAIIGILAAMAHAGYEAAVQKAKVGRARADIAEFDVLIERYRTGHRAYPDALDDFNYDGRLDPWGNPYYYTLLAGTKGKGSARKDHKLNPLNADYDLFSAGRDGVFKTQISQKDSLDDVIRARTGGYIGLAEDY